MNFILNTNFEGKIIKLFYYRHYQHCHHSPLYLWNASCHISQNVPTKTCAFSAKGTNQNNLIKAISVTLVRFKIILQIKNLIAVGKGVHISGRFWSFVSFFMTTIKEILQDHSGNKSTRVCRKGVDVKIWKVNFYSERQTTMLHVHLVWRGSGCSRFISRPFPSICAPGPRWNHTSG